MSTDASCGRDGVPSENHRLVPSQKAYLTAVGFVFLCASLVLYNGIMCARSQLLGQVFMLLSIVTFIVALVNNWGKKDEIYKS
jgi:hypothetical protein